jgi:uncharacterized membrane protein YdbT with pleckstrin-like domain
MEHNGEESTKGAIVFLVVFALVLVVTLANTSIPPGKAIYEAVLPNTEAAQSYIVLGSVPAIDLIISVFNGVIYGFIAWLIYTIATHGRKEGHPQTIQQTVNVNVGEKGEKKDVQVDDKKTQ